VVLVVLFLILLQSAAKSCLLFFCLFVWFVLCFFDVGEEKNTNKKMET